MYWSLSSARSHRPIGRENISCLRRNQEGGKMDEEKGDIPVVILTSPSPPSSSSLSLSLTSSIFILP